MEKLIIEKKLIENGIKIEKLKENINSELKNFTNEYDINIKFDISSTDRVIITLFNKNKQWTDFLSLVLELNTKKYSFNHSTGGCFLENIDEKDRLEETILQLNIVKNIIEYFENSKTFIKLLKEYFIVINEEKKLKKNLNDIIENEKFNIYLQNIDSNIFGKVEKFETILPIFKNDKHIDIFIISKNNEKEFVLNKHNIRNISDKKMSLYYDDYPTTIKSLKTLFDSNVVFLSKKIIRHYKI